MKRNLPARSHRIKKFGMGKDARMLAPLDEDILTGHPGEGAVGDAGLASQPEFPYHQRDDLTGLVDFPASALEE